MPLQMTEPDWDVIENIKDEFGEFTFFNHDYDLDVAPSSLEQAVLAVQAPHPANSLYPQLKFEN